VFPVAPHRSPPQSQFQKALRACLKRRLPAVVADSIRPSHASPCRTRPHPIPQFQNVARAPEGTLALSVRDVQPLTDGHSRFHRASPPVNSHVFGRTDSRGSPGCSRAKLAAGLHPQNPRSRQSNLLPTRNQEPPRHKPSSRQGNAADRESNPEAAIRLSGRRRDETWWRPMQSVA